MKKHIIRIAALSTITIALIFTLFPNQTTEQTEPEAEVVAPTPLVIETKEREEPINNPAPGTVTIVTPYQDSECWTGIMYINKDGDMMRITLFDAVESTFDDNF